MKKLIFKTTIIVAMVFSNFIICNAQTLYGICGKLSNSMDYLSSVDPLTGNVTIISSTALGKFISTGVSSLDPINNRFFFMSMNDTLCNVDLTTGNLISKHKISISGTYNIGLLEYNCKDSTLYAMCGNSSTAMDYLASVDPMTGIVSLISTTGIAEFMTSGVSALDPVNNRFFFMSMGDTLYNVNLATGNLVCKNKISVSGTYSINLIEFDSQNSTLYSINIKTSDSKDYLSTVDPLTGNVNIVSTTPLASGIYTGKSSLDPINNRFFFMSAVDSLYNVNLMTGNLISKNKISVTGIYNLGLLEYQKPCILTSVSEIENKFSTYHTIFPNPLSLESFLTTNNELKNATLTIYNPLGQETKIIKNISGKKIKLQKDNLPNGIYFIRLTQDNKVLITDKLIITD